MQEVLVDAGTYEKVKASRCGVFVGDDNANDELDADDVG